MLLQFDNLDDLDNFLAWAGRGRLGSAIVIGADPEPMTGADVFTKGDGSPADQEAQDLQSGPYDPDYTGPTAPPQPIDKPKRTRRTKAEIEAENAAANVAQQPASTSPEEAAKNTGGTPGETPAQAAIRQALEAAKLAKEAKAAGDAELAQAANAVAEALSPTDPKLLPHEFIQKRAAELGEMQAIEHLNAARNFIAKHGMPKYNESFQLCGLHANVMQFTPAECATHAAALEWLDNA